MPSNAPAIVLVNPQMGENIGATARAMMNFGLTDLRLVKPRDGWPNERAKATASGALDIMPAPTVYETFEDSIHDLHFVLATTSRDRDMVKPVYTPARASEVISARTNKEQKSAFVFGCERTGITNEDLSLCQGIINIPANDEFASLNLAQAVLLIAYEWSTTSLPRRSEEELKQDHIPATQSELHGFLARLQKDLEDRNFFRAEGLKATMIKNIQNIFTRADISEQELRTLHGILSALRGNKTPK